jgi:tetratricopeptide (TPR) repeat protein
VPAELERIVAKMLAKDPAERYATARDLLVDLRAVQRPPAPSQLGRDASLTRWWRGPARRERAALTAAVVLVVLVLAVVAYRHFRSPVFAERDWILVADFENRSGEVLFDRTVSELLRQALHQSRYVNVVPRLQILEAARRMGRTKIKRVDARLGREICQRENYRALLTGQVTVVGSTYQIAVQVVDPWKGVPVVTDAELLRSPADVYTGVGRLAQRVRKHLGESLAQIEKNSTPLARVTTRSLEALQRYSRALDLYARGELEACITLANSAVQLDPDFAMAHLWLANAHVKLGNLTLMREHLARARAGLERVTERERLLIRGADYSARGLYEKAAEEYRLLTELYPDDLEGHRGLAEASREVGHLEEAVQAQTRVLELDPHSAVDNSRLLLYLVRLNRFDEVLANYQEALARGVASTHLHWGAGLAHLGLSQTEESRREFDLLREGEGTYEENLALLYLARVLMYEGRMSEAAEMLRAGFVLDEKLGSESWIPVRRYLLAHVELARGEHEAARVEARRLAMAARAERHPDTLRRAGLLALKLGELNSAQQLLGLLDELRSQQRSIDAKSAYYNLRGELERAEGKPEAAIASQRAAIILLAEFEPQLALGDSYWERGDPENAIQAYLRFLEFKGSILRDGFAGDWVLTHLKLARAFAQAGDTHQALRYYDVFLHLWARADPDLPELRQAKVEREELIQKL